MKANPGSLAPSLVLRPTETQSVEQVATTRNRLVVALFDNVKGQVLSYRRTGGAWTSQKLDLPADSTISIASAADADDRLRTLEPEIHEGLARLRDRVRGNATSVGLKWMGPQYVYSMWNDKRGLPDDDFGAPTESRAPQLGVKIDGAAVRPDLRRSLGKVAEAAKGGAPVLR